jgi:predicted transcriptional regulator
MTKKVNCAHYIWSKQDKMLTDTFCEQCPEYDRCKGKVEEEILKRLLLEDGHKLTAMT